MKTVFSYVLIALLLSPIKLVAQQKFEYDYYIDNYYRSGVLYVDNSKNRGIYIDQLNTTQRVKNNQDNENNVAYSDGNYSGLPNLFFIKDFKTVDYMENWADIFYHVNDPLPEMKWELSTEKKVIGNLTCYKATTLFRGRNWTAWYCPEIPVFYGPWKFYGLPGLMVEITESENRFAFILKNYTTTTNNNIPPYNFDSYKKVTMKEMNNIIAEFYENMFNSSTSNDDGVMVVQEDSKIDLESGIEKYYE